MEDKVHLVADDREKEETVLMVIHSFPWLTRERLEVGDYRCSEGCCGFERKQSDFTVGKSRQIQTQVEELKQAYTNAYLIVNLNMDEWLEDGQMPQKKGLIESLMARNCTPLFIKNHYMMFLIMQGLIEKNHDGKFRGAGEFSAVRIKTHRDLMMAILINIPGVGWKMADLICHEFDSVGEFINAGPDNWTMLKGMGPKTIESIQNAFWKGIDYDRNDSSSKPAN